MWTYLDRLWTLFCFQTVEYTKIKGPVQTLLPLANGHAIVTNIPCNNARFGPLWTSKDTAPELGHSYSFRNLVVKSAFICSHPEMF